MLEHLADGHGGGVRQQVRDPLADGVVEREDAAVHQREHTAPLKAFATFAIVCGRAGSACARSWCSPCRGSGLAPVAGPQEQRETRRAILGGDDLVDALLSLRSIQAALAAGAVNGSDHQCHEPHATGDTELSIPVGTTQLYRLDGLRFAVEETRRFTIRSSVEPVHGDDPHCRRRARSRGLGPEGAAGIDAALPSSRSTSSIVTSNHSQAVRRGVHPGLQGIESTIGGFEAGKEPVVPRSTSSATIALDGESITAGEGILAPAHQHEVLLRHPMILMVITSPSATT